MRVSRPLAAAALAFALLALLPAAHAHAALASSDPPQGTQLDRVPPRVSVTLTEPVEQGAVLHVLDANMQRRDRGDIVSTGGSRPTISVGLPTDLPPGPYLMVWSAVSSTDGHPTGGRIGFTIGAFEAPRGSSDEGLPAGEAFARFMAYAGFSLAFAGAAFLLWMTPAGFPRRTARIAILAGATLHAAGALLEAAHSWTASGESVGSIAASLQAGDVGVNEVRLLRVFLAAAAWALALVWTFRPVVGATAIVTVLLLGSALTFARLGHPYAHGYATMALDFLHLLAAAVWVGGLALLFHAAWQASRGQMPSDASRPLGVRFGTLALVAVTVIAFSGLVLAVAVLGADSISRPGFVLSSPYGLFLLAKVLLAILMVGLAAINRYVLLEDPTDRGLAGALQSAAHRASRRRIRPGSAAGSLHRAVALEAGLGFVVLAFAGLLTTVPPPAEAAPDLLRLEADGQRHHVVMQLQAPRAGEASLIHINVTAREGGAPVTAESCTAEPGTSCVRLLLVYEGADAAESHDALPMTGQWMVHDAVWRRPGKVTATVTVATPGGFPDSVEFTLQVQPAR